MPDSMTGPSLTQSERERIKISSIERARELDELARNKKVIGSIEAIEPTKE